MPEMRREVEGNGEIFREGLTQDPCGGGIWGLCNCGRQKRHHAERKGACNLSDVWYTIGEMMNTIGIPKGGTTCCCGKGERYE